MSPSKILFKFSGSIACYKACQLVSRLVQDGHEVQVVATKSALEFIGASTLEGLTGKPVLCDTFERGRQMSHINMVKWADLTILCPATANTLNKMARGIGDDLVSSLFLAHDFGKPYLVAPAMNTNMYRHPATREGIERLTAWGVKVLPTASGMLACGDVGEGKLLDPDLILREVRRSLNEALNKPSHSLKILVTSGGTEEPVDGVRTLSNFSSGKTGAQIADYFYGKGHEVTLLKAERAVQPELPVETRSFKSFTDLDHGLHELLSRRDYDVVLHLAAVSDYTVDHLVVNGEKLTPSHDTKLSSEYDLSLGLARNYKIVDRIREYSHNPKFKLVAFKLTRGADEEERKQAVRALLERSLADAVVHNDLTEVSGDRHAFSLYVGNHLQAKGESKQELIQELEKLIGEQSHNTED